jgi:hypothetical protein
MNKNMQHNDFVQKVLDIINSSSREMPAHFTSNGDRTQSFCVDFDISEADEYEMASEVWVSCPDKSIIKIGEDIMLAAFIATSLNGEKYIPQIYSSIVGANNLDTTNNHQSYFQHCEEFGIQRAKVK